MDVATESLSTLPYLLPLRVTNKPPNEIYMEYKGSSMEYWFILHAILVPVLFGMISLVGLIGNILVIYVILSNARMRTVINLLLLNLAVADLCFVIVVPPFTAHQYIGNAYDSQSGLRPPVVASGSKQRQVQRRDAAVTLQNFKQKSSDEVVGKRGSSRESQGLRRQTVLDSLDLSTDNRIDLDYLVRFSAEQQNVSIEDGDSYLGNAIQYRHSSEFGNKSKLDRHLHKKRKSLSQSFITHRHGDLNRAVRDAIDYNRGDEMEDDVKEKRTGDGWKPKGDNRGRNSGGGSDSPAGSATEAACKFFHYIVNVTAYCTVYTLVMIAALRYMTVVHNVRTIRLRTRRNVIIIISLLWIVALLFNIPVLTVYSIIKGPESFSAESGQFDLSSMMGHQEKCDVSREVGQKLFICFFLLAYVIPLLAIALFSAAILRHLAKHRAGFERASVRLDDDAEARSRDSAGRACCSRCCNVLTRLCCCGCRCGNTQINGRREDVINGGRAGAGEVGREERVRLHKCDSGRSAAGNERRGSEAESVSITRGWNCCGYDNPNHPEPLRGQQQEEGTRLRHPQGGRTAEMKRQASRLIVLVVVMFAICWLPINVHLLIAFYMDFETRKTLNEADIYRTFVVVCNCLAYVNSCVNPFIYSHVSKDFRDAFRDAVGCRRRSTVAMEADQLQMLPMDQQRRDRRDNGLIDDVRGETGHVHLTPLSPNRVQREQHAEQEDRERQAEGLTDGHVDGQVDNIRKADSEKNSSKEASSDRGSSATGFCNQLVVADNDEVDEDKGLVDVRVDIDVSVSG